MTEDQLKDRIAALESVIKLGQIMRANQKRFFADRSPSNLKAAKTAERDFDLAASDALTPPDLFGEKR